MYDNRWIKAKLNRCYVNVGTWTLWPGGQNVKKCIDTGFNSALTPLPPGRRHHYRCHNSQTVKGVSFFTIFALPHDTCHATAHFIGTINTVCGMSKSVPSYL